MNPTFVLTAVLCGATQLLVIPSARADQGPELCNGVDDDGDGHVDEGCPCQPDRTCSGGLECVSPLDPQAAPTCHPACTNFCDTDCAERPDVLRVQDLGATPDDGLDDYAGLQAVAAAVSGRARYSTPAHVVFSPGTYEIQQYVDRCGRKACINAGVPGRGNSVEHIRYVGANDVAFHGCGARIVSAPTPRQVIDFSNGGYDRSRYETVSPFDMAASRGFSIDGFELDGSVDLFLPRDTNTENNCNGITTSACHDYVLSNLEVHHYARDGLGLGVQSPDSETIVPLEQFDPNGQFECPGYPRSECRVKVYAQDGGGLLLNVSAHNNGRNNLSIFMANDMLVYGSSFVDAGRTDNPDYRGYSPKAGIDVEPDFRPTPKFANNTGYASAGLTGNIVIEQCTISGNLGSQFTAGVTDGTSDVLIAYSTIERSPDSYRLGVVVKIQDFTILRSHLELGEGVIIAYDRRAACDTPTTRFYLTDSTLHASRNYALNVDLTLDCGDGLYSSAFIEGNELLFDGPSVRNPYYIYLRGPGAHLTNNHVVVAATTHPQVEDPTQPSVSYVASIRGRLASGNTYEVLDPNGTLPAGAHFRSIYPVPRSEVVDDYYPMPA
ncbi:MAG: hypothetical protein H6734_26785, partial [Alphaproteobacteria bacterium]|nr:hypothetical protein [Alphaproteobacteria bacterium]